MQSRPFSKGKPFDKGQITRKAKNIFKFLAEINCVFSSFMLKYDASRVAEL